MDREKLIDEIIRLLRKAELGTLELIFSILK